MRLTTQQAYGLFAKHGSYITEICDACGNGLGPVRYTRKGDGGVWCSRECRDGKEAHAPSTCKGCHAKLPDGKRRGSSYCDDACRKAHERVLDTKLSRTKQSIYAGFCSVPGPGSYPHSRDAQNGLITDTSTEGAQR